MTVIISQIILTTMTVFEDFPGVEILKIRVLSASSGQPVIQIFNIHTKYC